MSKPSSKHPETRCRTCRRRRRVSGITGRCLLCEAQTPRLLDDSPVDRPGSRSNDRFIPLSPVSSVSSVAAISPISPRSPQDRASEQPHSNNSGEDSALATISRIPHRAIERSQMLDSFITSSFPSLTTGLSDTARHQSVLHVLRNFDLGTSPLLSDAVEAVCLEAAAQTPGEQGAMVSYRAQDSYVSMLRRLGSALDPSSKVQRQHKGNHVAVAIMLMLLRTSVNDSSDESSFMMHRSGLHQFLHTRAQAFNWSSSATKGMFENFRLQTILLRVGNPQKARGLKMPPWPVGSRESTPGSSDGLYAPSSQSQWHIHSETIPDLLDRVDVACGIESTASDQQVAELFFAIDHARAVLSVYRHENVDQTEDQIDLVSTTANIDEFDNGIEEHCCISNSSTFDTFYRFSTHHKARNAACVWLCSLLSDIALLRLLHFRPGLLRHYDPMGHVFKTDIEASAFSAAGDLCRCIWYFSGFSESIAHAEFTQVLLLAAQGTFEACNTAAEYGWTQTCLVALRLRIQRLRANGRTTFCHVREATADIKQRCNWTIRMRTAEITDIMSDVDMTAQISQMD